MNKEVLDLLLLLKEVIEYGINKKDGEVDTITVWIPFYVIEDFNKCFPVSIFDEGGVTGVHLQENEIALDIKDMIESSFEEEETNYIIKKLEEWSE